MAKKYQRYELRIDIMDKSYINSLIVNLARQGYAPYYNSFDNIVCIEVDTPMLTEIKED